MNQKLVLGNGKTLIEVIKYRNVYYILLNDISDNPYDKKDYRKNNKEKISNSDIVLEVETLDGLQVLINSLSKPLINETIINDYYGYKNVTNINKYK